VAPVVANVTAAPCGDPDELPRLLEQQVTAPVRFTEMVERMARDGVDRVLEIGPGRVLSGLVGRIDRSIARGALSSIGGLDEAAAFAAAGGRPAAS
jgi:[acyl-carrier-protein] S-malonyltransferase